MKNTLRLIVSKYNKYFSLVAIGFILFSGHLADAQVTIFNDNFETGFGDWNDGGDDCARSNNTFVGGNWNIRLRDDTGANASVFSDAVDLTVYGQIDIRFRFRLLGTEGGDDFFVEYSANGNFTDTDILVTYITGSGVNNNITYTSNLSITAANFTFGPNSRFRFRSDGNDDSDRVLIDDILIRAYQVPANDACANAIPLTSNTTCENTIGTTHGASQSLPGCSGTANDDVWYSFTATNSEHTIRAGGSSLRDIAFEVFDGSCGGSSIICVDDFGGTAPESTTLTTLTVGNTYYIRVYSWSSNARNNGTFSICIIEPCSTSTANGTSALSCPSVDAGAVGLSGSDITINCSVGSTDIEATYLDLGETSSYAVESIPYTPPFQFNCLANPVSVNIDDRWSPVVNLPFNFCFYGNTYNSCVIGSNGVISFDTSLANTYSGWVISDNIPSANNTDAGFFGPSIYGVHHDVDPSVGGEIGYQLITLDSGCQALVAAWSDVPMYNDNSKLYTGMIVFYEDTNIIEVYIKEKQVVSGWNGGNAAVGLQEDATNGIVAPNRNSLSTNWTSTNEAWRFTPDGSSITTLRWYEDSIAPGNEIADPNDDGVITVSPTATTTYFAEVTYNLCNSSTIVRSDATTVTVTGSKTWNGSDNNNWHDADNWTPVGVPDITNCVTIPPTATNPRIYNGADGLGKNMQILDGADLLQQANSTLTIDDEIIVEPSGRFRIRTNASVIQVNDVATNNNIGEAEYRRRVNGVGYFDYVYWSSPVSGFDVEDVSPGSPSFGIYNWIPTVANGTTGNHGTWVNTAENMIPGKGYIVRGLLGTVATNQAQFEGILNNGQISVPISRGSYNGADYTGVGNTATADDDNWNLLGNPYPSAISLSAFLGANPAIDGTLYFWRHLTPTSNAIANPFYENYTYGSVPAGFDDGLIASGQGFFALMLHSASTPNTVNFSNTMRSSSYNNNAFYRGSPNPTERHRIWLDLVDESTNTANSILVGYIEGATNDIDRLYDGRLLKGSGHKFYSINSDKDLVIIIRFL